MMHIVLYVIVMVNYYVVMVVTNLFILIVLDYVKYQLLKNGIVMIV